ncbi:MAG: hypothetical protein K2Y09_08335, partial [Nitrosomonas sp.]|uniref:hypothetical protein n=1 Tax=Nitrosomonas sp. TaxID=42353 RepID=UPI001D59937A
PETFILGISMLDFSKFMNLYWFIRHHRRNKSTKCRYYRYAAAEENACLKQASIRKNCACYVGIWLPGGIYTLKRV